jgi:hypothetical protein
MNPTDYIKIEFKLSIMFKQLKNGKTQFRVVLLMTDPDTLCVLEKNLVSSIFDNWKHLFYSCGSTLYTARNGSHYISNHLSPTSQIFIKLKKNNFEGPKNQIYYTNRNWDIFNIIKNNIFEINDVLSNILNTDMHSDLPLQESDLF